MILKHYDDMNKIITLVACFVLLISCGSMRKVQQSESTVCIDSTEVVKNTIQNTDKVVDTTRTEYGKVTITEIEFYSPTSNIDDAPEQRQAATNVESNADVKLSNVGTVKGVVKSIKQTVIESDVEEKGESKETSESKESESAAVMSRTESDIQKHEEPTPDPYRWRYILYISLIGVVLLLYLKRVPIVNWIKKILSSILKIL